MLGVLVNSITILIGSFIGLFFRDHIKKEIINSVLLVVGLVVMIIGLLGVIKASIYIDSGILKSKNELLLLLCLSLGLFLGEILKIDNQLTRFGIYIEKKFNKDGFYQGFLNASLVFCVGAMAIIGSLNAATGDNNVLYLKAVIDGITAIILAASLGYGVIYSSFTVFLYQGLIVGLSYIARDYISQEFMDLFNAVGYTIVICIGINFVFDKKLKIANMLPALFLVIVYFIIYNLI